MNVSVDQIVKRACVAFDQGQCDANELNGLFDHLAREQFPGDKNYVAKGMATRWGQDLILKSAGGHLRATQMRGGHNSAAVDFFKRAPRPVDADKDRDTDEARSDGASGGKPTAHNQNMRGRTQSHNSLNPPETTPPNAEHEPSYDHLMKFKVALLNYLKANPRCSYEAAIDAVGSQRHVEEKNAKEATRFREMAR